MHALLRKALSSADVKALEARALAPSRAKVAVAEATALKAAIPEGVRTVKAVFAKARPGSVKLLSTGVYGVTVLAEFPGVALPVVVKFIATAEFHGCGRGGAGASGKARGRSSSAGRASSWVCDDAHGRRRRSASPPAVWTGNQDPQREIKANNALLQATMTGASPHFLFTYLARKLAGGPQRLYDLCRSLPGASADRCRKISKSDPPATIWVLAQEYGGVPLPSVVHTLLPRQSAATQRSIAASVVVQVLQALVTMRAPSVDLRHNDLHCENVLGCPTSADHVYYEVQVRGKGARAGTGRAALTRVFRVPTYGVLWRPIDLGIASSDPLFGKGDTATLALFDTAHVALRWSDRTSGKVAAELFDVERFANDLEHDLKGKGVAAARGVVADLRRHLVGVTEDTRGAVTLAKVRKVPEGSRATKDLALLQGALSDHGALARVFLDFATKAGYEVPGPPPRGAPVYAMQV
jgi:hypothetical protein